jgi:hypothetical protein
MRATTLPHAHRHSVRPFSTRLVAVVAGLVLVCCVLVSACTQEEGEPCQTDRDCADGLECRILRSERGKCVQPGEERSTSDVDSGEPPRPNDVDAATNATDASTGAGGDAAPAPEAGAPDDDAAADDSDGG